LITISRSLIRRLRMIFSRGLEISARQTGPLIEFHGSEEGLSIRTQNNSIAIEYRLPSEHPHVSFAPSLTHSFDPPFTPPFAVSFDLLKRCEGTKNEPVTLSLVRDSVIADWIDCGIPQSVQFHQEACRDFPPLPAEMTANPPRLWEALGAAAAVTDDESVRFALNHLRLRSSDGQIAASDGRQLLLQSGFSFPWDKDVLIPANRLFSSSDLCTDAEVLLGSTESWVCLRSGPLTLWLPINETARFPQVDTLTPAVNALTPTMFLSDSDAEFLRKAFQGLPSNDDLNNPITLDLNGTVSVLAQSSDDQPPTEVVLTTSRRDGDPVKVSTNRRYLATALQMGFRSVEVHGEESPMVCREPDRTFLWCSLDKAGIIAANPKTIRIESQQATNPTPSTTSTRKRTDPAMSNAESKTTRKRPPKGSNPGTNQEGSTQESPNQASTNQAGSKRSVNSQPSESTLTPLQAAEALRDSLKETLQQTNQLIATLRKRKKQSRLMESTLASLKQLQDVA